MAVLRFIFNDQLSNKIATFYNIKKHQDVLMFYETVGKTTHVKHHKKKIAFLFASMRHFAEQLTQDGYKIHYVKYSQQNNNILAMREHIARALKDINAVKLTLTEPSEWHWLQEVNQWQDCFKLTVEILSDNLFLSSKQEFAAWSKGKKQLRMEFFYREMRKKYNILLEENGLPFGGKWNFDEQNRKPPQDNMKPIKRISHKKSTILLEVLELVKNDFADYYGELEPFNYALTRKQALFELEHFIEALLPNFGEYQDAMVAKQAYLYHSLLSSYINVGLLSPLEICRLAEQAYRNGAVPLNSAEGFIRQILGWREYVRGIYWLYMPGYAQLNYFAANRPLPEFYWTGKTKMLCIAKAINDTLRHAYSHHIQRLMVTGNFALIAGLDVKQVEQWYLSVYSDAFEWVEMPNTLGMALFADGGIMASKPYAASGKYINRMSNFCQNCQYDPKLTTGKQACPLNALYWDFIARNFAKLQSNQRMRLSLANWQRFSFSEQEAIREQAKLIFVKLDNENL